MPDVSTLGLAVDSSGVRHATDDLRGFTTAGGRAEASTRDVEKAMTAATVKGELFGRAIGSAVSTVGRLASEFLALGIAAGNYQDIAEKTGASAAALASYRTAADVTNTSLEQIGNTSVRLSVALSKVDDESKGAGRALEYLGLNVSEFKALSPDDQIRTLAKALNELPDGANKSAVAVALLGRAGAEMLPFLKELGSETERVTILTAEQIKRADEFGDAAKRNRSEITQLAQALATETLPAVNAFLGAVKETIKSVAGVTSESKTLSTETGVRDFAESAAKALAFVIDAGDGVVRSFQVVGKTVGGYAAVTSALLRGNLAEAKQIGAEYRADVEETVERVTFGSRVAKQFEDLKKTGSGDYSNEGRNQRARDNFKATADHVAKVRDEYTSLIRRIQEKTAAEQAEYDSEVKLLPAQVEAAKVATDYASGLLKITPAQLANVDAALKAQLAIERLAKAREDEKKWIDEATNANATYVEGLMRTRDTLEGNRTSAQLDLREYGMTREELQALEVARLRDAAASLEQKAAQADSAYLEENARLYREQADALRDTALAREQLAGKQARDHNDPTSGAARGVKDYLAEIQRAGDATAAAVNGALHGLEDTTVAILSGHGGKDAAKQWVMGIVAEVQRLAIVRPLLNTIFNGGSSSSFFSSAGSVLGAIGSIFGGGVDGAGGIGNQEGAYPVSITGTRAGGGSVSAGNSYLVGERGPEILTMGAQSGAITPNSALGTPNIQIINQTGAAVGEAKSNRLPDGTLQLILKAAKDAVAEDFHAGGPVAQAAAGTYQLNRAASVPRY